MTYPFGTALVTGASSGIGEALARRLARAGVDLVIVARRTERLEALASELSGVQVEVLGADLTDAGGLERVAGRVADERRRIDLLVNNAGFGSGGPFVDIDPDRLDAEIALNVAALTRLSHAALSVMVPRRRGWLLNVSSVASFQPAPELAVYAATKAYVTSFTESLHAELRGSGVRVSALCPGLTRTEFQQVSGTTRFENQFPDFVWTDPDAVADDGLAAVAAGRAIAVPGILYKGLVAVSGVTPRPVARRLSSIIRRR